MLRIDMWVVFNKPTDYPDKFVARQFHVESGEITADLACALADTLQGVRDLIPDRDRLRCVIRNENDDPNIVEIWL